METVNSAPDGAPIRAAATDHANCVLQRQGSRRTCFNALKLRINSAISWLAKSVGSGGKIAFSALHPTCFTTAIAPADQPKSTALSRNRTLLTA
jgi:hypothetical protein